jgi:hypothetical protein
MRAIGYIRVSTNVRLAAVPRPGRGPGATPTRKPPWTSHYVQLARGWYHATTRTSGEGVLTNDNQT